VSNKLPDARPAIEIQGPPLQLLSIGPRTAVPCYTKFDAQTCFATEIAGAGRQLLGDDCDEDEGGGDKKYKKKYEGGGENSIEGDCDMHSWGWTTRMLDVKRVIGILYII